MLLETALVVAGYGAWRIYRHETSPSTKFKRVLTDAMDRAGIKFKYKSKSGAEIVETPKLLSLSATQHGWKAIYKLPVGLLPSDIIESRKIIQGATSSELSVDYEGQIVTLEFYTHKIPDSGSPDAIFSKDIIDLVKSYTLGIPVGFSRVGFIVHDLSEGTAPHISIGGQTGMGKSNVLNVIITSLAKAYPTDYLHLYLIDTKMVEFSKFRNLDIVKSCSIDIHEGVDTVTEVQSILRDRQELLYKAGFSNILDYNSYAKGTSKLPYIVVIIDEYGDFQGVKEFWSAVGEIGRKGRAFGIHLIMSTQRPDANTLPPKVKANLAGVIALKTKTKSNSQILIDSPQAFELPLKKGRALFQLDGVRELQIPYISDSLMEHELGIVINKRFKKSDTVTIITQSDRNPESDIIDITPTSNSSDLANTSTQISIKDPSRDTAHTISQIEELESKALVLNEELNRIGQKLVIIHQKYKVSKSSNSKSDLSKQGLHLKAKYESLRTKRDALLQTSSKLKSDLGKY
ncbi:FtsK/SpoIIIE-like protein [Listeria phage LIS04]|nr:FtsK/SpoIIIE-like protein [Listeria phage LIS04]